MQYGRGVVGVVEAAAAAAEDAAEVGGIACSHHYHIGVILDIAVDVRRSGRRDVPLGILGAASKHVPPSGLQHPVFIGTEGYGQTIAVFFLAYIGSVEIFAGDFAPIGDGPRAAIPPKTAVCIECRQILVPSRTLCMSPIDIETHVGAESGDAADFHLQRGARTFVCLVIDCLAQKFFVAEVEVFVGTGIVRIVVIRCQRSIKLLVRERSHQSVVEVFGHFEVGVAVVYKVGRGLLLVVGECGQAGDARCVAEIGLQSPFVVDIPADIGVAEVAYKVAFVLAVFHPEDFDAGSQPKVELINGKAVIDIAVVVVLGKYGAVIGADVLVAAVRQRILKSGAQFGGIADLCR